MDVKRNLLIVALAVVSYLMLLAWNEDYPAQISQASNPSTEPDVSSSQLDDLPAAVPTASVQTTTSDDLPQVGATTPPVDTATPISDNLIVITTPLQVISINPVGGDIVKISLPAYPLTVDTPDEPFVLMREDNLAVYVSQSGLIGRNGPDGSTDGRPLYRASQSEYSVSEGELSVDLVYTDSDNVTITKRFIINADDYLMRVQYVIDNNSTDSWGANLFGQIKRDAADDPSSTGSFTRTFLGAVLTSPDDPYIRYDLGDMDDGVNSLETLGGWIGFSQHYFLGSWIPDASTENTFSIRKNAANEYIIGFVTPETLIPAGQSSSIEAAFWAGPKDQYRLEEISPDLGLTIDYGMLHFVAYPIFWLLFQINNILGNFGWSIVVLTVIIKLIFYPLSAKQYTSAAKMKRLQPKITQLKDRYGDDKQKFMQAQMELWKKEKVNPFGSCLPVLLQMPVFLGIYWVLNESVELRQASFVFWYRDLSVQDPYFILPLLLGAAYFVQQTLTPMPSADPTQAKVMKFMPVMFTAFFLWFPAGLVLYYLMNTIFGILQQLYFTRKIEKAYQKSSS